MGVVDRPLAPTEPDPVLADTMDPPVLADTIDGAEAGGVGGETSVEAINASAGMVC